MNNQYWCIDENIACIQGRLVTEKDASKLISVKNVIRILILNFFHTNRWNSIVISYYPSGCFSLKHEIKWRKIIIYSNNYVIGCSNIFPYCKYYYILFKYFDFLMKNNIEYLCV